MDTKYIIEEVENLYKIISLKPFRNTPGVSFDVIPKGFFDHVDSMDRVIHHQAAVSPGPVGDVKEPWYMHPDQDDNLLVLHGTRYIDIFTPEHGRVEKFVVTPDEVWKNGEKIFSGSCMLVWPKGVFHRIKSGEDGSASINFAVHYEGLNIDTNFNIYDLDTKTGKYKVIREGHKDQKAL